MYICMKQTKILCGQLNCSVKVFVFTEQLSPQRIFVCFNIIGNNHSLKCKIN
jgi:hypothetical protein